MRRVLTIIAVLLMAVSCATQTEKQISKEKSSMSPVGSREEMMTRMIHVLNKSSGMSEKQKEQFLKMHDEVYAQTHQINQDIRKLKIILFRSLSAPKYDQQKIYETRSQIEKLYRKKLDVMIEAFDKVVTIIGKDKKPFLHDHMFEQIHLHN